MDAIVISDVLPAAPGPRPGRAFPTARIARTSAVADCFPCDPSLPSPARRGAAAHPILGQGEEAGDEARLRVAEGDEAAVRPPARGSAPADGPPWVTDSQPATVVVCEPVAVWLQSPTARLLRAEAAPT